MSTQFKIGIALAVTVIAVFAALWQVANLRGLKARGRRRARDGEAKAAAQRKSDSRNLKGSERRLYKEAQKLLGQGKVAPASRILEQLNMPREAIQALEDHGMIHEAAKILMRMQRHNRAGVVYARHGMWDNAAQCFKLANMPLEVAKCAREAGDLAMAAEYFEKVLRFEDAGECHEVMGDLLRAARFFASAGQRPRAMGLYNRLALATENLATLSLEESEVQLIVDHLSDGNTDKGLADFIVNRNKLAEVVGNLVAKGLVKQASELIVRSTSDIGPMLMADVSYQTRAAGCLAEVFVNITQFHYAGMVFERMSSFDRAGEAFERAEDFERAAYCYERAGVDFKVKAMKDKARLQQRPASKPTGRGGGFALANVQTQHDTPAFPEPTSAGEEKTSIVDMSTRAAPDLPPAPERAAMPPPPKRDAPALEPTPPAPERAPERPVEKPEPVRAKYPSFSLQSIEDDAPSSIPPEPLEETVRSAPETRATRDADTVTSAEPVIEPATEAVVIQPVPAPVPSPVVMEEAQAAFHKASFFADLDFEQKNKLWTIGETLAFGADESVLTYNDEPKGVYVIVQGSVSCYRVVNGKESYVDQMGESESFGELWLLADQPTAVRFVAAKNTRIRVVGRDRFNDLLDKDGLMARKLYKRFTMRLLKRLLKPQNGNAKAS